MGTEQMTTRYDIQYAAGATPVDVRKTVAEAFSHHDRAVLHYSGGKDSISCLFLCREYWSRVLVLWVDTGDAYPEIRDLFQRHASMVTREGGEARRIETDAEDDITQNGYPSDVVPIDATPLGKHISGVEGPIIRPWLDCCLNNISVPLDQATTRSGCNLVIRGVRQEEMRGRHPKHVGGREYLFPVFQWSSDEVLSYLDDIGEKPDYYNEVRCSLNCMHCTGDWRDLGEAGVVKYLQAHYPEKYKEVAYRLGHIASAIAQQCRRLDSVWQP